LNATIGDSPPVVTFSDVVDIPSRHELENVVSSISSINDKLKALDREIGLSKQYNSKSAVKPGQGRMSPVDGDSDVRWKMRDNDQGKRGSKSGSKGSSLDSSGSKFPNIPFINDKMED